MTRAIAESVRLPSFYDITDNNIFDLSKTEFGAFSLTNGDCSHLKSLTRSPHADEVRTVSVAARATPGYCSRSLR